MILFRWRSSERDFQPKFELFGTAPASPPAHHSSAHPAASHASAHAAASHAPARAPSALENVGTRRIESDPDKIPGAQADRVRRLRSGGERDFQLIGEHPISIGERGFNAFELVLFQAIRFVPPRAEDLDLVSTFD
jgi:hypothetical protein